MTGHDSPLILSLLQGLKDELGSINNRLVTLENRGSRSLQTLPWGHRPGGPDVPSGARVGSHPPSRAGEALGEEFPPLLPRESNRDPSIALEGPQRDPPTENPRKTSLYPRGIQHPDLNPQVPRDGPKGTTHFSSKGPRGEEGHQSLRLSPNDFQLAKGLSTMCQLEHNINNWFPGLPTSLERNLGTVFDNLNPPLGDTRFRTELFLLKRTLGEDLWGIVLGHLERKRFTTEDHLSSLDLTNLDQVVPVAIRQYLGKGTKAKGDWVRGSIRECANRLRTRTSNPYTGTATDLNPNPAPVPRVRPTLIPVVPQIPPTPIGESNFVTVPNRKRGRTLSSPSAPPPCTISNKFAALEPDEEVGAPPTPVATRRKVLHQTPLGSKISVVGDPVSPAATDPVSGAGSREGGEERTESGPMASKGDPLDLGEMMRLIGSRTRALRALSVGDLRTLGSGPRDQLGSSDSAELLAPVGPARSSLSQPGAGSPREPNRSPPASQEPVSMYLDVPPNHSRGSLGDTCRGPGNSFLTHPTASLRSDWRIQGIRDNTVNLILSDSNFRPANSMLNRVFSKTEIHVYPGGKLEHIPEILGSIPRTRLPPNIVLSFGINNRQDRGAKLESNLEVLKGLKNRFQNLTFMGVSTQASMDREKKLVVTKINNFLRTEFNFVEPLEESEVVIEPGDVSEIHHTEETVGKILRKIRSFLEGGGIGGRTTS